MSLLSFNGRLVTFAGDARDNDPFYKLTIKTKEESESHSLLGAFRSKDEGIDGAYKWANSPGYGRASHTLTDPLAVKVNFDIFEFDATLVSITMSKRATPDLGTIVEYAFNLEKTPTEDDSRFWTSYLKQKEDPDTLVPDEAGRVPKAKTLEYSVQLFAESAPAIDVEPTPDAEPQG